MGVRRRPLIAISVAVTAMLASLAAASPQAEAPTPATSAVATSAATVPALATDQACTRHAGRGDTLQTTPYRPDDLAAMTLPKAALGSAVKAYRVDWSSYGYTDNAELWKVMLAPKGGCDLNRAHGRISGFSRAYWGAQTVDSSTHLFFSAQGARRWLTDYIAGMKDLVGHKDVVSVRVTGVPSLGPGAVQVTDRCNDGCTTTRVFFPRGGLIGSVRDSHPTGTKPAIDVVAVARRLSARMATRMAAVESRAPDAADAVMMLSAGLTKSMLGSRYSGLVWDWFFGGCWDPVEAKSQGFGPLAGGMRTFCRAMYVPPEGTTAVRGVERVFTGGILYRSAALAGDALANVIHDYRARAGRTVDGTSYGPLVRWDPGSYGDRTVGLQQRVDAAMTVRAFVLRGRYVEEAALNARSFTGMKPDVRRWTRLLDARVWALLTTRTP